MQHLQTLRPESHCYQMGLCQSPTDLPARSAQILRRLVLHTLLVAGAMMTQVRPAHAAVLAPSAPDMTDASDSGFYHFDNLTNVTQPIFVGTGSTFASVTLYAGATPVGYGIVGPTGHWTLAPHTKLKDGSYNMTVRQTVKGVQSAPSSPLSIVIDTVAPDGTTPSVSPESDSGLSDADNETNMTNLTFNGVASPGNFVSLYNTSVPGGAFLGQTVPSGLSAWKITPQSAFPSGTHTFQIMAKVSDRAGNVSTNNNPLSLIVDTDTPAAPSNICFYSNPGGFSASHITNDPHALFAVKAEAHAHIELYDSTTGELIDSAFADQSGIAQISAFKALIGDHTLYAVCSDRAGNQSPASSPVKFTFDIVAPTSYISTPYANAILSAFPTVTGTATDYHGIAQVKVQLLRVRKGVAFYWNGTTFVTDHTATVNATLVTGSTSWKWDTQLPRTSDLDAGSYALIACSYDTAGNWEFSDTRYFTLLGANTRNNPSAPSGGTS